MRFLMVDRICELERGKRARGIKNISWDNDFLEETFPGITIFSPVIAVEAAAQLVSWIVVEAKEFTVKPVIIMADAYHCSRHILPGDQLELHGEIESFSEESALAHGSISINGRNVIEIQHAVCYFYPLDELNPPEQVRQQFKNLYREGSSLPQASTSQQTFHMREHIPIKKRQWVDRILDSEEPHKMYGVKNVTNTEDYFNDHFPLKPILPGVITLESLISLAKSLVERKLADHDLGTIKPILKSCKKIKFRKFVHPGDQLLIDAHLMDFNTEKSALKVKATINQKTVSSLSIEFVHLDRQDYLNEYISRD